MKKELPDWNIAATHCFVTIFAIPFLPIVVAGILIDQTDIVTYGVVHEQVVTEGVSMIINLTIYWISIWFGVWYSANRIMKKYDIKDVSRVIRLSIKYTIVILGGYFLISAPMMIFAVTMGGIFAVVMYAVKGIMIAISIIIFSVATRKYMQKNISVTESSQVDQVQKNVSLQHEDGVLR